MGLVKELCTRKKNNDLVYLSTPIDPCEKRLCPTPTLSEDPYIDMEATAPIQASTTEITGMDVSQCLINQPDDELLQSDQEHIVPPLSYAFPTKEYCDKANYYNRKLEQGHVNASGSNYSVLLHVANKYKVCIGCHVFSFLSKAGQAVVQNN